MKPKREIVLSDSARGFLYHLALTYPTGLIWDNPQQMARKMRRSEVAVYQRLAELRRVKMVRRGVCGAYYCPSVIVAHVRLVPSQIMRDPLDRDKLKA